MSEPTDNKVFDVAPVLDNDWKEALIDKPIERDETFKLHGFATDTFLDGLFFDVDGKTIFGIPLASQLAITGLPDSGKSILIEEIAVRVTGAIGRKVLLVTSEDIFNSNGKRFDLLARLKQKADILDIDWKYVMEDLFVMDAVKHSELRDWVTFAETYRYIIEKEKIELVLVDSLTLLEDYRGALKGRLMEMVRYNQKNGITAIFVNQRTSEDADKYAMAGGIGIAHNLDGTIVIDYTNAYHKQLCADLNVKRGEPVKFARVLGCRLCNFNRKYLRMGISEKGFLVHIEPEKETKK